MKKSFKLAKYFFLAETLVMEVQNNCHDCGDAKH
jgi:hypothetical protein